MSYVKVVIAEQEGLTALGLLLHAELDPLLGPLYAAARENQIRRLKEAEHAAMMSCWTPLFDPIGYDNVFETLNELWLPSGLHVRLADGSLRDPLQLSDAELDGLYTEQVKQLDAMVDQRQQQKRSSDAKCAAATEALAATVQAVSPEAASAARALRDLAQKIRQSGLESLAGGNP